MYLVHIPGYHFCGPGTEFSERISRGEIGVNKLDELCRLHDTVYTDSTDEELRRMADKKLIAQAWDIVKANDSSFTEKISASVVTGVMKLWTGFKQLFNS